MAGVLQGNTFTLLGNIVDNASLVFDQYVFGNFRRRDLRLRLTHQDQ